MSLFSRRYYSFLAIGALASMASCEYPAREYLDTIPSDARVIAQADLDAVLKMSACESQGGSITLTPQLTGLLESIDTAACQLMKDAAAAGSFLDLTRTFIIADPAKGSYVITAPFRSGFDNGSLNGSHVKIPMLPQARIIPLNSGVAMVYNDCQAWIADAPNASITAIVDSLMAEADRRSVADSPALVDFFSAPASIRACITPEVNSNPFGDDATKALAEVNITERSVYAQLRFLKGERYAAPFNKLQAADTYALGRMPFAPAASIAIGVNPSELDEINTFMQALPLKARILIEAASAIIDQTGGTITAGAAPGGNAETIRDFSSENWLAKLFLPVTLRQEAAYSLIDEFSAADIYCLTDSDYLVLSNYDPEAYELDYEESVGSDGEKVLVSAQVPYKSELMKAFNLRQGYSFYATVTDSAAYASLRAYGPSTYLLPTLIDDLNRNTRLWSQRK